MSTIIGLVSTFRLPLHSASFLDFLMTSRHYKIQSDRLQQPNWTSSVPHSTKKSNFTNRLPIMLL